MKNLKTNLVGIVIIIAGIVVFIRTNDYTQAGAAILVGAGFLFSKDNNVTGGTVAQ